jgi:hypothetical protein
MKRTMTIVLPVAVIGFITVAGTAFAQRDAASKARGDAYYFYSGHTYDTHAIDHARILNQYSATGQPVPKEVVKEHSAAIRSNVEAAKKSFAKLSDAAKKDPATAKKLAEVEKHHAKVLEMCDMLDEECLKKEGDSATVCSCCTDIEKELKAAEAVKDSLSKQLKLEKPTPVPTK